MPLTFFTRNLLKWYSNHQRPLPWKGEKDPYLIWLSEIILQQTQVEQGRPYYERFKSAYPTVHDLAEASEDEIMKRWEGLGYYSRARNLHATAKYVSSELSGSFPQTVEGLLSLKGVGEYTAAAIGSFAFGLPAAVVDGNVIRVLSRFFGITEPVDTTKGKKIIRELAGKMLDEADPGRYNQAIMDFGAGQCKPKNPLCDACPLSGQCVAYIENTVDCIPVKAKKIKKKTRYFNYLVIEFQNSVYLQRREAKDVWKGLYQFPLIETEAIPEITEIEKKIRKRELFEFCKPLIIGQSGPFRQTLTHQKIIGMFYNIKIERPLNEDKCGVMRIERKDIGKFAFPRIIDWFLKDKSLYLQL